MKNTFYGVATIAALSVVLLAGGADAFDGKRKGFVLGGGLGMAPLVRWEGPAYEFDPSGPTLRKVTVDESRFGAGAQLVIGYAWDEANMLVAEGNAGAMSSKILDGKPTVSQGFGGISWYHYFGEMGRTFFSAVGVGGYTMQIEHADAADEGFGALVGGGYEFSPHWQVGGYLTFGDTTDPTGDNNHVTISVLVSGVAF